MTSKIHHIRLDDEVADKLRAHGSGRIPEGIRMVLKLLELGGIPAHKQPHAASTQDTGEPKSDKDGRTLKGEQTRAANALKAKQEAEKAHNKLREYFRGAIRDVIATDYPPNEALCIEYYINDGLTPEECDTIYNEVRQDHDGLLAQLRITKAQERADEKIRRANPPAPQPKVANTVQFTKAAIAYMGNPDPLPEYTDDQIIEINNLAALTPAAREKVFEEPAHKPVEKTLDQIYAENPLTWNEDEN